MCWQIVLPATHLEVEHIKDVSASRIMSLITIWYVGNEQTGAKYSC